MKLITVILSIYIIAISAMPCFDVHVETNSVSIENLKQNDNQKSYVDLCSPFCFCNCCQSLSDPNFLNNMQCSLISYELSFTLAEQTYLNPTISFWRPPKI
jgi:hypothetical protein